MPQGVQVGYITNDGSISQAVYLDAGTYNISFFAVQRVTDQGQPQTIEVLVDPGQTDAQVIGTITPINSTGTSVPPYSLFSTSNFTVAEGVHTIEFLGTTRPPPQAQYSSTK